MAVFLKQFQLSSATFKSSIGLVALCFIALTALSCEQPDGCTINSECGTDRLCRVGECKPKCLTYLTCEEGEACVDGACEVPTADYCSHVVPNQTPPDMEPYAPCPPGMLNQTAGMAGEMTAGETTAGETTAGETTAGETTAGDTATEVPAE